MIDDSSFHVESFGFFYGKDESDQTSFSPKMGDYFLPPFRAGCIIFSNGQIVFTFYSDTFIVSLLADTTCED